MKNTTPTFLKIFQKFQKEVLEETPGHIPGVKKKVQTFAPSKMTVMCFKKVNFPELITFLFLKIFQKFQKEVLKEIRGHLIKISDFSMCLHFSELVRIRVHNFFAS